MYKTQKGNDTGRSFEQSDDYIYFKTLQRTAKIIILKLFPINLLT